MESNKNKEEDILLKGDPVSWGVMVSTFIQLKIMLQLKIGKPNFLLDRHGATRDVDKYE